MERMTIYCMHCHTCAGLHHCEGEGFGVFAPYCWEVCSEEVQESSCKALVDCRLWEKYILRVRMSGMAC